jgi:ubiquitin C-terminal hydrolase
VTTDETKVMSYFAKHELEQNKSEITQLLRGIIHNTIICHNCKTASHSYDVFLALSLPIPQK